MKLAIISDAIYPYNKGGKEKKIHEVSIRLAKKGHEVHIYTMKWWGGEDIIKKEGVYLHGVCRLMPIYNKNGRRSIKEALWFSISVLPKIIKEDFDLVEVDEFPYFPIFPAKVYCLLKNKSLVTVWHEVWGDYWYEYMGKQGVFGKFIEKGCSKLTKHNIAVSESTKRRLAGLGVDGKNVTVIPNGIDIQEIEKVNPSGEKSDIIFAGRLIKEKNVDVLINAVAKVKEKKPNIKCTIIGDGPERKKLETLAEKLDVGNNIKFLKFMEDHSDVLSYMKSSKIFVLPSTREGFGIVVLEANACGLPVIAIKHPMNAAEDLIIDGETGFKGELSDTFISERIITILDNDELRNEMSGYSKDYVKDYDWGEIFNNIIMFYGGLK